MAGLFLSRALLKILAEKEVKQKQHARLRQACEAALEEINKENQAQGSQNAVGPDTPMPPPQEHDRFVNADKYFTPFRLACESKSPRIIRTALDCLQKLMAYGHLTGEMLAEVEGFPDAMRLIDLIVDTIRTCFIGEQTDEGVQLQIIKALLTAVTTPSCDVHEGTLLKAVRTCYSVYLASKNIVNQTTAKATLTQMLSVIFQRMETLGMPSVEADKAVLVSSDAGSVAGSAALSESVAADSGADPSHHEHDTEEHAALVAGPPPSADEHAAPQDPAATAAGENGERPHTIESVVRELVDDIIAHACAELAAPSNLQNVPSDSIDNVSVIVDTPARPAPRDQEDESKQNELYGHVHRKDAFLVLRSICKLALKDLPDRESIDRSSHDLRSKLLSLDLQLMIVENAGPVLRSDPLFIEPIKQFLCTSLMKNGASHVPEVFERSVSIFLLLLAKFKAHLKSQIDVFFKDILLNALELPTSSFQHKWTAMMALGKVCQNKQTLMDLYVNFDCEELLTNIFERMVNDLSKAAQGRPSVEIGGTPQQELNMKVKGLECLVSAMRCFEELCAPLESQLNEEILPKQEGDDNALSHAASALLLSSTLQKDPSTSTLQQEISSPVSETAEFESRKVKKEQRERGIELFNKNPMKGIAALQDGGFLSHSAAEVAALLHAEPRLDRTAMGEYMGEKDDFCIAVMHAFIDQVDFRPALAKDGISFLEALRIFLGCFKLPGESQKIDRMMLKFAQRYCDVHPDNRIFASADAAYVLAYSIIMLNTDLHNTQVKRKITKDGFVRMTRGINDNRDLPKDYVENIFDAISKTELHLNSGDNDGAGDHSRVHTKSFTFTSATDLEHVRPMFKLVWRPVLAAFTIALKTHTDPAVIATCLEGLQISIHIACIFLMTFERDAFLKALANFTNLSSLEEIKHKNLEAVKTMLAIAVREGNFLNDAWRDVLFCVSQLELAQLIGAQPSQGKRKHEVMTDGASMAITMAVDRVFSLTRRLTGDAIVDFVRALCLISHDELHSAHPRMYSLAKLVDVAYYNMERVRVEWAHMWAVMGEHFNKVGCLANTDVACFAVDSLRQLSMKFLEKGELANYSFQKDFLRPFEFIMSRNKAATIRDMVVRCVAQMVQAKSSNIRSGWKNIFFVFSLAASDSDQSIVDLAFSTTTHIFDDCFSKQHDNRVIVISSSFIDAVNCMAEFACNAYFPEISMEAIRQLRICATHVANTPELFVGPEETQTEEPKIWVKGWFPVLFGLSRIINRCKLDVRTRALTVMFEIMKVYGSNFLPQWWVDLFRVVFRIFDDKKMQTLQTEQDRAAWLSTTCTHALRSIVDVLTQYFAVLQPVLMGEMFTLLERCICESNSEHLGRAGTECLHIMVMSNGVQFTDGSWAMFCLAMQRMFVRTTQKDLLTYGDESPAAAAATNGEVVPYDENAPARMPRPALQDLSNMIIMQCVTQLELIQTLEWILLSSTQVEHADARPARPAPAKDADQTTLRHYAQSVVLAKPLDRAGELFSCLSSERLLLLLDSLQASHDFSLAFNANTDLRNRLWKLGFMKNRTKPNLYRQETSSMGVELRILFRIYTTEARAAVWPEVERRLTTACTSVLRQFAHDLPREGRDSWVPNVALVLRELLALSDERFASHAATHYAAIAELLTLAHDGGLGELVFLVAQFFVRARAFVL